MSSKGMGGPVVPGRLTVPSACRAAGVCTLVLTAVSLWSGRLWTSGEATFPLGANQAFAADTPGATERLVLTQKPTKTALMVNGQLISPAGVPVDPQTSTAKWIWGAADDKNYFVRKVISGEWKQATLKASCDNAMEVWVNGEKVGEADAWETATEFKLRKFFKPKQDNTLVIRAINKGGAAGLIGELTLVAPDDKETKLVTDETWQVADSADAAEWIAPRVVGQHGDKPWGNILAKDADVSEPFHVLPGYQVELLFTVPKETMGSWVNLVCDPQGRLIASDQQDKGLYRITPPAIGSSEETKVEKLDVPMTGVQGFLFAHGALYVSVNGGPGSGLYRLKDTNNDDQFDEVVKLKEFRGGGEHGPHALRMGPDGESIYVIAGNHVLPPFELERRTPIQTMAGIREEQLQVALPEGATSRIAPNWDEDLVTPRQWDAGGHAVGVMAPGGWVAKTDKDGKTWETISVGYRNPFDMAFNADNELFVYDADMEWDYGLPWYRPTRINHATSGSEFGWRSGSGKWPKYYLDSLAEVVDIGPGSPVGVDFGYGLKFPAKYQKALYICDWTFGTMYAIHIEPSGASYKGVKEEFLSRTPLPLTDVTVGKDGAMYFTMGGRGTQSGLFRVTYTGTESTAPVDAKDARESEARALRHKLEAFHTQVADAAAVRTLLVPSLASKDRVIRYTVRVALERVPTDVWSPFITSSTDFETVVTGVAGLARVGGKELRSSLLTALGRFDWNGLSEFQLLELIRAYQLVVIRLGLPEGPEREAVLAKLDPQFPASSDFVTKELAALLVALDSAKLLDKAIPLLAKERKLVDQSYGGLLERNKGYGEAVAGALANAPDMLQTALVFDLRSKKSGWSLDHRKAYFGWFEKARAWSGGNSYQKYLTNIDREAFEAATEQERLAIEALGARKPYVAPELPKAKGPGQAWTTDTVLAAVGTGLTNRNFKNGQTMFAAARCIVCHRFGGDGGATGPDLTQTAGRFGMKDLVEAIVDPSKVISDQYKATVLQTTDGKTYTGRVVSETGEALTMVIDPEDSSKIVTVKRSDIEEMQVSGTSLMPKELLLPLNEAEVLDMLAYILSRGDAKHAMFR